MPKKREDFESEAADLQDVVQRRPEPCVMHFHDWNEATHMKARFNRLIRHQQLAYREFPITDPNYDKSPYNGLRIAIIKPGSLLFTWKAEINPAHPVNTGILDGQ